MKAYLYYIAGAHPLADQTRNNISQNILIAEKIHRLKEEKK